MRKGVAILLACCALLGLCGCSLLTPSIKECKDNVKELVEKDNRWHASITVKGSTQGGSDFTATGECDVDIIGGTSKSNGYMRVYGNYMSMEETFDVIHVKDSSSRYTYAGKKDIWVEDTDTNSFQTAFQALIDASSNNGRFTNRTASFNGKSCYFLAYNVKTTDIIRSLFPCDTQKVIGKDYLNDVESLSVMLYFTSDRAFEGAAIKSSGAIGINLTISKPAEAEEFSIPEKLIPIEDPGNHPLIWNWRIYDPNGGEPMETAKKEPAEEDVKRSEALGRNSNLVIIDGHNIEFPCLLSVFEDIGYTVKDAHTLTDSELCEFTLTRDNGDLIIATVFNEQTREISYRDALVISITVDAEESTNTSFVFPCGVQLMASERNVQARYGTPFEREDIDGNGNYVMCYYRVGTSMLAIVSYYYDMVDEVEIGPIEYYTSES